MLENLQMQQTPKPLAHVPDAIPPLLVHSELKKHDFFTFIVIREKQFCMLCFLLWDLH